MPTIDEQVRDRRGRAPPPVRRKVDIKALAIQGGLTLVLVWLAWSAIDNVAQNMQARKIPTSFQFLWATAGFDINQSLISYSATSTYGRAFLVGLLNTLAVAAIGIVIATILGFIIGVARLSRNWLAAKLAGAYVEILRNTPLLLQLLFWYTAVLAPLPGPRQSLSLPALSLRGPDVEAILAAGLAAGVIAGLAIFIRRQPKGAVLAVAAYLLMAISALASLVFLTFGPKFFIAGGAAGLIEARDGAYLFLNNRGLFIPAPLFGEVGRWLLIVAGASAVCAIGFIIWARRARDQRGVILPAGWIASAILLAPLAVTFWAARDALGLDYPQLRGFNLSGGVRIYPEAFALVLGLSLYTAAFIAEIVRAGILAVAKGQTEAAAALGLRPTLILNLVVIPQAMRVIIPPLTSQYLNLTKNSSLAVFIGFPELVQVFVGTVLNQTGAMIQIVSIAMAVYLTISLLTSFAMNMFNRRMALKER